MTVSTGYSLWLMPSGHVRNRLADLISRLSGEYSSPGFEPHVTLIGNLPGPERETVSKTSELAASIRPLKIELDRVDFLDEYFRCLFIRAKKTEGLMQANLKARRVFGRLQDPAYMPHLSLMYGNFAPAVKRGVIATIGKEFDFGFVAKSVHLFSTGGKPGDWYRVGEFPLFQGD